MSTHVTIAAALQSLPSRLLTISQVCSFLLQVPVCCMQPIKTNDTAQQRPEQWPNNMQIIVSLSMMYVTSSRHYSSSRCVILFLISDHFGKSAADHACRVVPICPGCCVSICYGCHCHLHGFAATSTQGSVSATSSAKGVSCGSVCPQSAPADQQ